MVLCYHYIILLVPTQCILNPSEYVSYYEKRDCSVWVPILDVYSTYPGPDVNEGKP